MIRKTILLDLGASASARAACGPDQLGLAKSFGPEVGAVNVTDSKPRYALPD